MFDEFICQFLFFFFKFGDYFFLLISKFGCSFKSLTFKKGQTIISEGDKVDCEYFVISGCLKAFFINDEPFTGKPTYENLSKAIDAALKKVKKKPAKQRA